MWTHVLSLAVLMVATVVTSHQSINRQVVYAQQSSEEHKLCLVSIRSSAGNKLAQRKNLKTCINDLDSEMEDVMAELREAYGQCGRCGKTAPYQTEYSVRALLNEAGFQEEIQTLNKCLAVQAELVKDDDDEMFDMDALKTAVVEKVTELQDRRLLEQTQLGLNTCAPVVDYEFRPYLECVIEFCAGGGRRGHAV